MWRRDFIKALGASAAAWPLIAHAQQPAIPLIGFFYPGGDAEGEQFLTEFRKGLSENGYADGRNVTVLAGWGESDLNRATQLVADFVRRNVSVIVAAGFSVDAARAATTTIPIIFTIGYDPVKAGYVASLNRPGGNVTGVSTMNIDILAKWVGLLRQLLPSAKRFAVLVHSDSSGAAQSMREEAKTAADAAGLELLTLYANRIQDFDGVFEELANKQAEALLIMPDVLFLENSERLATLALNRRIPTIYAIADFTRAGGLMSYGSDYADAYRLAGIMATKILKGEKPSDLPVERASKFKFVINLRTAKALNLTISPNLLALADEVIE